MSNTHPTKEEWQDFNKELESLSPAEIADRRYSGDWGTFNPNDPTQSDPRVREANRYLTELKERRNLVPVTVGVWAGVFAVFIGSLALPIKDSVLTQTLGSEQAALRVMQGVLVLFAMATISLAWKSYRWLKGAVDIGGQRKR